MMRLRTPVLSIGVLVVGAATAATWYWGRSVDSTQNYITAPVTRGDLEVTVTATGTLQPAQYVDVGTQVSGQLQNVSVQIGDIVRKGQLVAQIDPTTITAKVAADHASIANLQAQRGQADAKLESLKAQLSQARAKLEFAESEKTRNRALADKGLISVQQQQTTDAAYKQDQAAADAAEALYKQGRAEIEAANAQIEQAQANLKIDETNLGFTKIYAPMNGAVVAITARVGQTLNATQQAPVIMRIANIATMTVWAQVSEADVQKLHPGMDAYFTLLGEPANKRTGTLRQIQPTPDIVNTVVLYNALIDVPNPDQLLKVQMTAQVFFVLARAENALLLPVAALQFGKPAKLSTSSQNPGRSGQPGNGAAGERGPGTGGGGGRGAGGGRGGGRGGNNNAPASTVLVFGNGQFEPRTVRLGVMNRVSAEVLSGVNEGERVAVGIRTPQPAGSGRGQGGGQGQGRGQL
jgi:macrolide-specific efflux system membrane fusion protein